MLALFPEAKKWLADCRKAFARRYARAVGRDVVQSGAIEAKWADFFASSAELRLCADYDIEREFTVEEAQSQLTTVRGFVERMRAYLLGKGLTEQELTDG